MKHLVLVTLFTALLSAGCASHNTKVDSQLPTVYVPKHPELNLPDPVFRQVTLKQTKEVVAQIQPVLLTEQEKHPDLAAFVGIVGALYINAHRSQIMDCSDKRGWKAGPGMADPDCLWTRPAADDWVGCMALQFSGENVFQKFHLGTIKDETVFIWIDRNYDAVVKDPNGLDFLIKLNGLPQLGAQCDKLTQDEPPEGSIAI